MIKYFFIFFLLFSCKGQITDPSYTTLPGGNLGPSPVLQIHNLQGGEYVKGGSVRDLHFTVTDAIGFNSNRLEYSKDNGLTWALMTSSTGQNASTFATSSGVESVFNWAVPNEPNCAAGALSSDSGLYKIRIFASGRPDAMVTLRQSATTFTVDSCGPNLAASQFTTGLPATQNRGFIQFSISGINDAFGLSPIRAVCIKSNSAAAPAVTDSCWRSLSSLRVANSANPAAINLNYFAGFTNTTFNFYLWAMDQAENISTLTNAGVGTEATDLLASVVRNCTPASKCAMPVISAGLTARVSTTATPGFSAKTGGPSLVSTQTMIDPKYFIVTANGTLIYRDATSKSILKINLLNDLVTSSLIAAAAAIVDGDQTVARVFNPTRLAMDAEENLYIFDDNRIRKVVFTSDTTFQISTVVGSGADSTTQLLTNPLDLQIPAFDLATAGGASAYWYSTFEVLQNGQIYFSPADPQQILNPVSVGHAQIKFYDPQASVYKLSSINLSGTGVQGNSAQALTSLVPFSNFGLILNSVTSAVQKITTRLCEATGTCANHSSVTFNSNGVSLGGSGHAFLPSQWSNANYFNSKKGDLYSANAYEARLSKFNTGTLNWDDILGTANYGTSFCADGTSALSCDVRLWDAFIGYNNQTFFIDNGRLRFIDTDGRVKTLLQ